MDLGLPATLDTLLITLDFTVDSALPRLLKLPFSRLGNTLESTLELSSTELFLLTKVKSFLSIVPTLALMRSLILLIHLWILYQFS